MMKFSLKNMAMLLAVPVLLVGASQASATLIVDYTHVAGNIDSRAADSETLNGDTWNFSDTTELIDENNGPGESNVTLWGGLQTSWSNSLDYDPRVRNNVANGFQVQVNPNNGSDTAAKGIVAWIQSAFLNGGDTATLGFAASDTISLNVQNAASGTYQFVVKEGGTYYVSQQANDAGATGTTSIDPTVVDQWAIISTADYTIGTFASKSFSDIEAVGFFLDLATTAGQTNFRVDDFQANATAATGVPEPASLGLLAAGGLCMLARRRRRG